MSQAAPEPPAAERRRRWPWFVGLAVLVLLAVAVIQPRLTRQAASHPA